MKTGTKARRHVGTKGNAPGAAPLVAIPSLRASVPSCLRASHSRRRLGYSFTEVMFAVVVLGIGFIMIAAMFPVAISQSQTTNEESTGASIARGAVQHITSIAGRSTMRATDAGVITAPPPVAPFTGIYTPPPTAGPEPAAGYPIVPANTGSWEAVRGNLILQSDPRYAFVPFYARKTGSSFAKLIIITVRARSRPTYDASDVTPDEDANLQPRPVTVKVVDNVDNTKVDWVTFTGPAANIAGVAEGTCVVIAAHAAGAGSTTNYYAGQVFRVGRKVTEPVGPTAVDPDTWELVPGNDFIPSPGLLPATASAFIVGRELEVSGTPGAFRGVSQEVSYYTTFVQVKP